MPLVYWKKINSSSRLEGFDEYYVKTKEESKMLFFLGDFRWEIKRAFRNDDWNLSGIQFAVAIICLMIAVIVIRGAHLPELLELAGAIGIGFFGFQALTETTETTMGRNPHIAGRVAWLGLAAGVIAAATTTIAGYTLIGSLPLSFIVVATDIVLANGFGIFLPSRTRSFLLSLAVADDLVGVALLATQYGLHPEMDPTVVGVLVVVAIILLGVSIISESTTIFFISGFISIISAWGFGVEPFLGMTVHALIAQGINQEWRREIKNIGSVLSTVGLGLYIISHFKFTGLHIGEIQMRMNISMILGKFIGIIFFALFIGDGKINAILVALIAACSGTVGTLFLNAGINAGKIDPSVIPEASSAIFLSVVLSFIFGLLSAVNRVIRGVESTTEDEEH